MNVPDGPTGRRANEPAPGLDPQFQWWAPSYRDPDIARLLTLRNVLALLTTEQEQQLRDDLAEMARLRRKAEAESRNLWMGG